MPSEFVTTQRFEDHVEHFDKLELKVSALNVELGSKVSWVVFWSVFTLLIGLASTVITALYISIKDVQKTGTETQNAVFYIKGTLDNSEITK